MNATSDLKSRVSALEEDALLLRKAVAALMRQVNALNRRLDKGQPGPRLIPGRALEAIADAQGRQGGRR